MMFPIAATASWQRRFGFHFATRQDVWQEKEGQQNTRRRSHSKAVSIHGMSNSHFKTGHISTAICPTPVLPSLDRPGIHGMIHEN
jgi:hypothetical protein